MNEYIENFTISQMVFATQFKKGANTAIPILKSLKSLFNASCNLLYVNTPNHFKTSMQIESAAKEFMKQHDLTDFGLEVYNDYRIEDGVMKFSEKAKADLTVACTDGSTWMSRVFQGRHTESLVNESPTPVLVFNLSRLEELSLA